MCHVSSGCLDPSAFAVFPASTHNIGSDFVSDQKRPLVPLDSCTCMFKE